MIDWPRIRIATNLHAKRANMDLIKKLKELFFSPVDKPIEHLAVVSPVLCSIPEPAPELAPPKASRELLKEATVLKNEKQYTEACQKLREAYSAEGAQFLMVEDRLRLPMYLLLAGKNDEGWDELKRLDAVYIDDFSQLRITNQISVFQTKEAKSDKNFAGVRNRERAKPSSENLNTVSPCAHAMTVGELQRQPLSAWGNADITNGLKFHATLQLGTPLRVLLRHGEIHTDETTPAPRIARKAWEGMWMPVTKSFEEMLRRPDSTDEEIEWYRRLDVGSSNPADTTSDVGPVREGDYLPFLIAVRKIIEEDASIEHRIQALRHMIIPSEWRNFLSTHSGISGLVDRFFPEFMNLGPELDTPNRIAAAPDSVLLNIKGIGPATLKSIRESCAGVETNRDGSRVDLVGR